MNRDRNDAVDAEPVDRPTLDYGRGGGVPPEFQVWRPGWWRVPRHQMAAGLACVGLGWGLTLTWFPVPPILIGVGGFLVGLALPTRNARRRS